MGINEVNNLIGKILVWAEENKPQLEAAAAKIEAKEKEDSFSIWGKGPFASGSKQVGGAIGITARNTAEFLGETARNIPAFLARLPGPGCKTETDENGNTDLSKTLCEEAAVQFDREACGVGLKNFVDQLPGDITGAEAKITSREYDPELDQCVIICEYKAISADSSSEISMVNPEATDDKIVRCEFTITTDLALDGEAEIQEKKSTGDQDDACRTSDDVAKEEESQTSDF